MLLLAGRGEEMGYRWGYEVGMGMRVRGRSEVDGVGCVGNGLV